MQKDDIYFYNGNKVKIIEVKDNCDFVLVQAEHVPHTEINGSNFCAACNIGDNDNKLSHTCHEADEMIEAILDSQSQSDIYWVDKKFLQNKPLEFVKWEKLNLENKEFEYKISNAKKDLKGFENLKAKEIVLVNNLISERVKLTEELSKITEEIQEKQTKKLNWTGEEFISIDGSKVKISLEKVKKLLKRDIILNMLEVGGVDNWEWYDAAFNKTDEKIDQEVLEDLFNCCKEREQ
jgi:hypothetical protein